MSHLTLVTPNNNHLNELLLICEEEDKSETKSL